MKKVHGACPHDCPDTCAWVVTVNDEGEAIEFHGDPDHPFTKGALCSKLKRYPQRVYSQERVLYPLKRSGPKGSGEFVRISWDQAIEEVSSKFKETIEKSGPLAVLPYNFAGTIGMLQRYAGEQFFSRLGATEIYPFTGSSEIITDITSTGETLKANNLRVLKDGIILKSQACLMISKLSSRKTGIKKIINLLSK